MEHKAMESNQGGGDGRKTQSNRDRRQAQKRRLAARRVYETQLDGNWVLILEADRKAEHLGKEKGSGKQLISPA